MPIDPSIPLGAKVPEMQSPLRTLGAIAQLRGYRQLEEERQLQNENRRRDLEDEDAIKDALQTYGASRPDDAVGELYRQGRATAAQTLSKSLYAQRKQSADEIQQRNLNTYNSLKIATQIAQSANDQSSWSPARSSILRLFADNEDLAPLAEKLPTEYDEPAVKRMVAWGTDRTDYLKQQQDALDNADRAINTNLKVANDFEQWDKNEREADTYWHGYLARILPTARNQQEWDFYLGLAQQGGARDHVLKPFGDSYSPTAATHARTIGMTANEQQGAMNQATDNAREQAVFDETKRHNKVQEGKSDGAGALTQSQLNVSDRWKKAQEDKLEEDFTKGLVPREQLPARKLDIENAWRRQIGQKSINATIADLSRRLMAETDAAKRSDLMKRLKRERDIYFNLTGK